MAEIFDQKLDTAEADAEPKISKRAAEKAAKKAAAKASKEASKAAKVDSKKDLPVRPKAALSSTSDAVSEEIVFTQGWLKQTYEDVCKIYEESTGKKCSPVTTRFPPEPNGFLHIGHAKAVFINFGFAAFHEQGPCYLRFDDTNPTKEEAQYFEGIERDVRWLGYEPYKITHSSDNFERLYELAEVLIQKDKAYVCHCNQEEINLQKGGKDNKGPRYSCAHRDRPIQESLEVFRGMRDGKYKPKEAVLRFKMPPELLNSGNTYCLDLSAYRILDSSHHRTGNKWRIYPTYDFAHCLCDSMEHITHSMCTVEFFQARTLYDWLITDLKAQLPAVPQQREFGRLNVTGTVTSKRKILQLVANGLVRSLDDPRLYTLAALRRRGIPPGAIRAFVAELGVSDALVSIQTIRLETTVRKYLEMSVPRLMLVPDPILVTIDNLPVNYFEDLEVPFIPKDPSYGTHKLPFTGTIYIDRSDFREEDSEDFFRLAPGKLVGLLHVPFPIRATSFTKDVSGRVTEIHATYEKPEDDAKAAKPKAYIQWVALSPTHKSPIKVEVRIFNPLFKSDVPDSVEGGFMNDIRPNSEEIFPNAVMETGFWDVKHSGPYPKDHVPISQRGPWDTRFQGLRVAYFTEDVDSTQERVVLNKIVSLREDSLKNAQ